MISNESITLRVFNDADIQVLTELRNNLELQFQLLCRPQGSTCENTRKWLESAQLDNKKIIFIIAEKSSNGCVGYIQLFEINQLNRNFKMGICLAPGTQRQGLGTVAVELALSYMAQTFGMRKCFLEVRKDNTAAMRCYQKAGFLQCGCYTEHIYIDNIWHDVLLMERKLIG